MSMTAVKSVDPRSPARRAGVRVGDTLTHINGHPIVRLWTCWTISFTATTPGWSSP